MEHDTGRPSGAPPHGSDDDILDLPEPEYQTELPVNIHRTKKQRPRTGRKRDRNKNLSEIPASPNRPTKAWRVHALKRYRVLHWLANHPKVSVGSGLGMAGFALATELSGASKLAALFFFVSWAIWSLVIYFSPLWHRSRAASITSAVGLLIALLLFWWVLMPSPDALSSKVNVLQESQRRTEEKVDQLLKGRGQTPEQLLAKYPLGYVIYEISYRGEVFPYGQKALEGYEFDWNVAGIDGVGEDTVSIRLPDINDVKLGSTYRRMSTTISKRVGAVVRPIAIDGMEISVEVIDVRETGIVFLIGFKKR